MVVRRIAVGILLIGLAVPRGGGVAHAAEATIVALGASHTYGKGVARNETYPAQLEALLRAKGYAVRVINAGVNGDTTAGMLARLDRAVPGERRWSSCNRAATTGAKVNPWTAPITSRSFRRG
jgi:acyl-CoA thioesterase-1